jgi:hypothetical protein
VNVGKYVVPSCPCLCEGKDCYVVMVRRLVQTDYLPNYTFQHGGRAAHKRYF